MNTAVIQRSTPKQQALTADIGQVASAIGTVPAMPPAVIAAEIVRFVIESNKALDQAERAVIKDNDTAGRAADLLKAIGSTISSQEAARKQHTAPLDAFKAKIMKFYGLATGNLEQAKEILKEKAGAFARAERDRLQAEADQRQRLAEEEAARLAAAQAALGDQEGADQILEEAAARPTEVVKVSATGVYGASLGLRTTKKGSVNNNRLFIKFLAGFMDSEPAYGKFVDDLRFPQSALNDLARAVLDPDLEAAVAQPDGFVAEEIESISSR
jgi:hypothetical protein